MQFQKIYLFLPGPHNIADFFAKGQHCFGKNSTFTQSNSMRAVLEIF